MMVVVVVVVVVTTFYSRLPQSQSQSLRSGLRCCASSTGPCGLCVCAHRHYDDPTRLLFHVDADQTRASATRPSTELSMLLRKQPVFRLRQEAKNWANMTSISSAGLWWKQAEFWLNSKLRADNCNRFLSINLLLWLTDKLPTNF